MKKYLTDIEYAATSVISSIWHELIKLKELNDTLGRLIKTAEDKYRRAENLQQSDDIDDYMTGVGVMWDAYFNEDKEAYHKNKEVEDRKKALSTLEFAIQSLSASLLQMAKQGISMVHGGLQQCPDGRLIGTQSLKQVIWQGRNQAIHFEEGKFTPVVVTCFETLTRDVDPKFNRFRTNSLAFEIVDLLGWKTFEDFEKDMLQLS